MEAARFEVWYSDGVMQSGCCRIQWKLLPDNDVQFLVVEWESGAQEKISGEDEYVLFGHVKLGRWTSRENYFHIVEKAERESRIFNGGIS